MSDIDVRPAELDDLETIVDFNQRLAFETESKRLDANLLTEGVRRIVRDATKGQYFVAVNGSDGAIVGQIMFTREWSDWRNGDILWIQSVYVAASHRRRGVFRLLLSTLRAIADDSPEVVGLRLYVEKNNVSAQATYRQLGFTDPDYLVLESIG